MTPNHAQDEPEPWLDLSSISCRAAIEIDNLISGLPSGVSSVGRLSELLAALISVTDRDPNRYEFQDDPTALAAINEAMGSAEALQPESGSISRVDPGTVAELQLRAKDIKTRFERLMLAFKTGEQVREDLSPLKAFCLALAASSSRHETFDDHDDDHPFMR